MSKVQKIWLYIFGAMFLIPEILFLNIPLAIDAFLTNFSEARIKSPIYYLIDGQFFTDHSSFLIIALFIEWIGTLFLTILLAKLGKKSFAIIFGIISLFILFILYLTYAFSKMSLSW